MYGMSIMGVYYSLFVIMSLNLVLLDWGERFGRLVVMSHIGWGGEQTPLRV